MKGSKKDKIIDIVITVLDIIIWSMPIAVVAYVLIWFINK